MPRKIKCKAPVCSNRFERGKGDIRTQWCSPECGIALARHRQDKARRRAREKQDREKKKSARLARKERNELNRRDVNWQLAVTQKVFNEMRRLECFVWYLEQGLQPECISCGSTNPAQWHCGHYYAVGRGTGARLRFDRRNTELQCSQCNKERSANKAGDSSTRGYTEGLSVKYGEEAAEKRLRYLEEKRSVKVRYRWDGLEAKRRFYSRRVRKLKMELGI